MFCLPASVHHENAWCLGRADEGIRSPGLYRVVCGGRNQTQGLHKSLACMSALNHELSSTPPVLETVY